MASENCTKCGVPLDHSWVRVAQCKACRNETVRLRRESRDTAKVDPLSHDYANSVIPEGFHARGVSQYIRTDEEGNRHVVAEWVKSAKDPSEQEALEEYLAILKKVFENVEGKFEPSKPLERAVSNELMDVVPIGDAHIGLLTWWKETGNNFDLDIARDMYKRAYAKAFENGSGASTVVLSNLGDYYHTNSGKNQTYNSTPVDVDGRWPRVLETGIEIMLDAVRQALTVYEKVRIYTMAGNHDKEAAVALRLCLHFAFMNDPRVEVMKSPRKVQFLEFGKNLIGFSHGDMAKPDKLPMIMAADQKEAWGRVDHRHFYGGHVHHDQVKDFGLVKVETVRVLAPADAWHTEAGYRSCRDIKIDTWHARHGRIDRSIIGISRIMEGA